MLGGPGPCSVYSGSEHNDYASEKYLLNVLVLSKGMVEDVFPRFEWR